MMTSHRQKTLNKNLRFVLYDHGLRFWAREAKVDLVIYRSMLSFYKKSTITLVSVLALLTPMKALAGWVPVAVTSDLTKMALDPTRVVYRGSSVLFVKRNLYARQQSNGATASYIYESIDCSTGKNKINRIIYFDSRGRTISDKSYGDEGKADRPTPGSVGAMIEGLLCSRRIP